jgi:hypothetical protein
VYGASVECVNRIEYQAAEVVRQVVNSNSSFRARLSSSSHHDAEAKQKILNVGPKQSAWPVEDVGRQTSTCHFNKNHTTRYLDGGSRCFFSY